MSQYVRARLERWQNVRNEVEHLYPMHEPNFEIWFVNKAKFRAIFPKPWEKPVAFQPEITEPMINIRTPWARISVYVPGPSWRFVGGG